MKNQLSLLDHLIDEPFDGGTSEYLRSISIQIQKISGNSEDAHSDSFLFRQENELSTQSLIAWTFIRILDSKNYNQITASRHKILKQIQEALPVVCKSIKLDEKSETYEKEKIFRKLIQDQEKEFYEIMKSRFELSNFAAQQSRLRKFLSMPKNDVFHEFSGMVLTKSKLDSLFGLINEYIQTSEESKYAKFLTAKQFFEELIDESQEIGTKYMQEHFSSYLSGIYGSIVHDMERSPYYLPCTLKAYKTEKKYPLAAGVKGSIQIGVSKKGKGYAHNATLKIKNLDTSIITIKPIRQLIGQMRTEYTVVDFQYEAKKDLKNIELEVEVSWTTATGDLETQTEKLFLQSQSQDIHWEKIMSQEPYSLEPIDSDTELVGRDMILRDLRTMLSVPIGSAYVFGQRRVGKTSIVKTLLNSNKDDNLLIYYIEAGDWNDANSPFQSMDNLAEKICRKIKRHKTTFSSIEIPKFNGSFTKITNYLEEISDVDKDFKLLLILDEFDRISSSLYERGEVGQSFVLTLRSISNRPNYGIILVGGEKLEYILSPWQEFNKFSPIRVDYFTKERDWEDFKRLIKKPVEGILEITDGAINAIYEETAGNPYFTKKICMKLFSYMIANRDVHVTSREVLKAIASARDTANIGATDFSHFWEDGIKGTLEKEEEISVKRRKVLIAISYLLLQEKNLSRTNIADAGLAIGLKGSEVEKYLLEFEQRRILLCKDQTYGFVVKFFHQWLLTGGLEKIIASFEEEERVSVNQQIEENVRITTQEIAQVLINMQIYKGDGISVERVRDWINQFDDVFDQRLVFKLLQNFKLYSEAEIRRKLVELGQQVNKLNIKRGIVKVIDSQKKKNSDILVSYLDKSPAKGAPYFAKLFADECNIYFDNICSPESIEKKISESRSIHTLVLIDDFIGSGNTIINNSKEFFVEELRELISQKGIMVVFGVIAGFLGSVELIAQELADFEITIKVLVVDPLNADDKCFSSGSTIFSSPAERKRAKELCRSKGELLEPKAPLGYSDCEALIAFPMNCPNNTLPIFWKRTDKWVPLFERK